MQQISGRAETRAPVSGVRIWPLAWTHWVSVSVLHTVGAKKYLLNETCFALDDLEMHWIVLIPSLPFTVRNTMCPPRPAASGASNVLEFILLQQGRCAMCLVRVGNFLLLTWCNANPGLSLTPPGWLLLFQFLTRAFKVFHYLVYFHVHLHLFPLTKDPIISRSPSVNYVLSHFHMHLRMLLPKKDLSLPVKLLLILQEPTLISWNG